MKAFCPLKRIAFLGFIFLFLFYRRKCIMQKKNVRNLMVAGLLVAFGLVFPQAFHMIPGAGPIFLPMHIPVLMAGLMLGWKYGLAVGFVTPILSHFIFGMPPIAPLPMFQTMIFELPMYGAVVGLLVSRIRTKSRYANLYASLIGAMIAGRLVMGALNALWFSFGWFPPNMSFSLQFWMSGALITAWPGILIQLVFVPSVAFALEKAFNSRTE